jgi:hypothetical protein
MKERTISMQGALFAEFANPAEAARASTALRARGYGLVDTYSPFPISHEDSEAPTGWLPLSGIALAFGIAGALAGYLVQWYTNAQSYALNIGGRPANAPLAFVIPAFEATLLLAVIATFVGVLIVLRLPRLWRPEFEIEQFDRATSDRFWVAVPLGSGGGDLDRTRRELEAMRPLRVLQVRSDR